MKKLNFLKARSTWVVIFTLIVNMVYLATGEKPFDPEQSASQIMLVIDALAGAWVYFERVTGEMKLVKPGKEDE